MKKVLIIGSGIAGLSTALSLAENGIGSIMVSPYPSERAQSVMAAGGINAADPDDAEDSVASHIEDTLKAGRMIAGTKAVTGLCEAAPEIVEFLKSAGTVFTRDSDGSISRRAFGGQSHPRTCYCGASTGKLILTSLVMKCREYEAQGLIERRIRTDFHSALIESGICYGALLYDEERDVLYPEYASALVLATGGQNALFGKTTGSTICDGYAAGRVFMQGAALKNLEFIQYHPTTIETSQKRMLVSEAARGEGGRLFYEESGKRIYFMEDKYGADGNLMPRDIVSREEHAIEQDGKQVYLDVSFLGDSVINGRIPEVRDICLKYGGIDITKYPVPISPSVHFFMGGLAVNNEHETNIENLYAAGECASIYHGANRLGGNSLLAAIYSGRRIAASVSGKDAAGMPDPSKVDFDRYAEDEMRKIKESVGSESRFPVKYIRDVIADTMRRDLGIVRDESSLEKGLESIDYYLDSASKIIYDSSVDLYYNYSLEGILTLARAVLVSAKSRKESRGAHIRSDCPNEKEEYRAASIISFDDGEYTIEYDKEGRYES